MHHLRIALTLVAFAAFSAVSRAADINIIPRPAQQQVLDGQFTISAKTRIVCSPALLNEAQYLADQLRQSADIELKVEQAASARRGAINILLDSVAVSAPEGYTLDVTDKSIVIRARRVAGAFYALQSMLQLMPPAVFADRPQRDMVLTVQAARISDAPMWPWRGMMLDVSRYFHDINYLRHYIDMMATYKLNVLQLHLVDDAGWRLEIKKYPLLTEVGAWAGTDTQRLGGYYTQDEMRQLVAYAQVRGVTIVPEIEFPAHMVSAIAAYPWLSCRAQQNEVQTQGFISGEIMCAGNDACYDFLADIFDEVCSIFPSPYVNIGGDEANYDNWKTCARCQALKAKLGLKTEAELQGYVTNRAIDMLKAHGRTVVGWNEIAERGPLNAPVVANCWHEPERAAEHIGEGHKALLSPVAYCYFDMPESRTPGEVQAATWSTPISLEKAYSLRPSDYTAGHPEALLGVQACLWSDQFIVGTKLQEIDALDENRSEHYIDYLTFPRALALSEIGWSQSQWLNYADFSARLSNHFAIFDAKNCHYRVPEPQMTVVQNADGTSTITLVSPVAGARLRYRTDGHYPNVHSTVYEHPVTVKDAKQFMAITEVSARHFSLPVCPAGFEEKK